MTPERARAEIVRALGAIAPEADLGHVDPKRGLRDQLDLDSMDFLNFVAALHAALGVDVPERDYAKLDSLDGAVAYLAAR